MPTRRYIDRCTDSRLTLTDDEIREINRRMTELGERDPRIRASGIAGIIFMIGGGCLGGVLLMWLLTSAIGKPASLWIVGLGLPSLLVVIWLVVFGRLYTRNLRRALVDCGHPVCVFCGYLLDGVGDPCCPECGKTIERRTQGADAPS